MTAALRTESGAFDSWFAAHRMDCEERYIGGDAVALKNADTLWLLADPLITRAQFAELWGKLDAATAKQGTPLGAEDAIEGDYLCAECCGMLAAAVLERGAK